MTSCCTGRAEYGTADLVQAFLGTGKIGGHKPSTTRLTPRGNMLYSEYYPWRRENSVHSQEETQDAESGLPREAPSETRNELSLRCLHSSGGMSFSGRSTRQELSPGSQVERKESICNPEIQG